MMTMMNRSLASLVLCVLLAGSALAQGSSKATAELNALLNEFLAGAGRNDAAIHDRFWAEDLIYTRSAGARTNKEELMNGVRSAPPPKPSDPVTEYSAEDVQIRVYGSTAVVAFRLVGRTTRSDGSKDVSNHLNTGTFVRRNRRWQAVAWQATTVPKPVQSNAAEPATSFVAPAKKPDKVAGRTYVKGPQGGCYYIATSGRKTYVNKELCN
jgi:hypothetical protein